MTDKKSVETLLSELGKKIDNLIQEAKQSGSKISEEMEEKIELLRQQKNKLEEEIRNRANNPGEKWIHAREHLNDAAEAMRRALEALFKKP